MKRIDYGKIVADCAKKACGDCISTPCPYCGPHGTLTTFGLAVVARLLAEQKKQQRKVPPTWK